MHEEFDYRYPNVRLTYRNNVLNAHARTPQDSLKRALAALDALTGQPLGTFTEEKVRERGGKIEYYSLSA